MSLFYNKEKNKYTVPMKILSAILAFIMVFSMEIMACYAMGAGIVEISEDNGDSLNSNVAMISSDEEAYIAGKYEEENVDASFTYKGVSFDFIRTFDNRSNSWFFSVNSTLTYNKSTDRIGAVLPDNRKITFIPQSSTSYCDPHSDYLVTVERDSNGSIVTYSIDLDGTIYNYDADGKLASVSNKNGHTITITRYTDKIVVADGVDRSYTFVLDSNMNIVSITDPAEGVINYTYDTNGRLIKVVDQAGVTLDTYSYDSNGRISKNNDVSFTYDSINRVTFEEYDSGAYNNYVYDGNTVNIETSTERNSVVAYNIYGDVTYFEDDSGYSVTYTYDSKRRVIKEESNIGDTVIYSYDSNGNLLKSETDEENYTTYLYDTNGNCVRKESVSDSEASYTYYAYDQVGNAIVTATLKKDYEGDVPAEYDENLTCFDTIEYNYADGMLVESVNNKDNETVTYTYDAYGNDIESVTSIVENEEITTTTIVNTYDLLNNTLTTINGENTSSYIYDAAGRTLLANNNGKCTRTLYDGLGRVVQEIGFDNYDAAKDGLPEKNTYSDSKAGHTYKYATNGTLTSETNRLGKTTKYYYNDIGSKVREEFDIYKFYYLNHGELYQVKIANVTTVSYNYDNKFRLTSENYANDDVIRYEYNNHGKVIAEYHNSNAKPFVTYTYNEDNELTEKINTDTGLKYIYGEDGQVSIYKASDNTLVQSYTEVQTEADGDAGIDAYTTVTEKHFGTSYTSVFAEGMVSFRTGSGTIEYSYSLNGDEMITSALVKNNNGTALSLSYSYDDNGNITSKLYSYNNKTLDFVNEYDEDGKIIASGKNSISQNYIYDDSNQLIGVHGDDYSASYTYDSRGNLTSKTINGETTTFTYANTGWKDLLVAVDDVELTYDSNGNVLTYGDIEYTWNSGRHLDSITDGNNTYTYKYDENGIRTSKTVNGKTTYYNTKDGVIIAQSDEKDNLYFQYDNIGTPFGFIYNGTQYLYITNQMSDVVGITNESGTLLAEYSYDEWGNILSIQATGFNLTLAKLNPIRYRGYYYDLETGYYYLQSRYYDPVICRFINSDEIEIIEITRDIEVGTNLFAYCTNDPIANSDIRGTSKTFWLYRGIGVHFALSSYAKTNYKDLIKVEVYTPKSYLLVVVSSKISSLVNFMSDVSLCLSLIALTYGVSAKVGIAGTVLSLIAKTLQISKTSYFYMTFIFVKVGIVYKFQGVVFYAKRS